MQSLAFIVGPTKLHTSSNPSRSMANGFFCTHPAVRLRITAHQALPPYADSSSNVQSQYVSVVCFAISGCLHQVVSSNRLPLMNVIALFALRTRIVRELAPIWPPIRIAQTAAPGWVLGRSLIYLDYIGSGGRDRTYDKLINSQLS